jgi:hypothetical protein
MSYWLITNNYYPQAFELLALGNSVWIRCDFADLF